MTPQAFNAWLDQSGPRSPLVMGILNVTPDSFSDGGEFADALTATRHAAGMAADGADLIDIGGESTRPGAVPVAPAEQIRRVVPVIENIRKTGLDIAISIDTRSAEVAQAALDAGASIINDVAAGSHDPQMLPLAAGTGAPIILMHMRGQPATMQQEPVYADVTGEVATFLRERMEAALAAGISPQRIVIDPGIGFGKTDAHDLQLLREIGRIKTLGRPVLMGVSRKRIIGSLTGHKKTVDRLWGTAAAVAWSVAHGADIVRVHDVAAMRDVVRVIERLKTD